ncbi:DNA polymerase delta subunit 4 [Ricinus communis]|uniref:Delta DNA polymerase, putative n=1 Tax=Ricinus communis TaxID=3988 RepID=B9SDG4_RICCO|nr:DNA polymerase delta subunit 4 [Ricinus communis]EEF38401.1 delta DNA polymerase, putative [Ricinus communis]|eukprot:XP_002524033.1 DNA polymerase delta subunit 4 [Ricinus communis]
MATASPNDMKSFYRQKKTNKTGITKSSSKSKKKSPPKHAAAIGSNITQPTALISHGGALDLQDDYDKNEEVLRQFDMNMAYGPCLGMTRVGRWERAQRLGLNPPKQIEDLLKGGKVNSECLWDGRV